MIAIRVILRGSYRKARKASAEENGEVDCVEFPQRERLLRGYVP